MSSKEIFLTRFDEIKQQLNELTLSINELKIKESPSQKSKTYIILVFDKLENPEKLNKSSIEYLKNSGISEENLLKSNKMIMTSDTEIAFICNSFKKPHNLKMFISLKYDFKDYACFDIFIQ